MFIIIFSSEQRTKKKCVKQIIIAAMASLSSYNNNSFLQGKNAIITGGSGTIGMGIAQGLLSAGCNVYLTGRNQEKLDDAKSKLLRSMHTTAAAAPGDADEDDDNSIGGGRIFTLEADCTNEESVIKDIFEKANVDLLVNNAGTTNSQKTEEVSVDSFKLVMDVNVVGPFICSREAIKQMKARKKGGRIINIGSISAMSPRRDAAAYTTSKFALLGLTHSLALDCRDHGIAVGIIHPGNTQSDLLTSEEVQAGFLNKEDIAKAVVTMASLPYNANISELTITPTMPAPSRNNCSAVLSPHLTPAREKKRKRDGTALPFTLQGNCRGCGKKTTHQCSVCLELDLRRKPWYCRGKHNDNECFRNHVQTQHGDESA